MKLDLVEKYLLEDQYKWSKILYTFKKGKYNFVILQNNIPSKSVIDNEKEKSKKIWVDIKYKNKSIFHTEEYPPTKKGENNLEREIKEFLSKQKEIPSNISIDMTPFLTTASAAMGGGL